MVYRLLTHWGRVTHICVSELPIIGSDNGLSPGRRQAIIWKNAGLLLIESLGTNFSEILIEVQTISFKKMELKMSSAKWRPFCLGLNVLITSNLATPHPSIESISIILIFFPTISNIGALNIKGTTHGIMFYCLLLSILHKRNQLWRRPLQKSKTDHTSWETLTKAGIYALHTLPEKSLWVCCPLIILVNANQVSRLNLQRQRNQDRQEQKSHFT